MPNPWALALSKNLDRRTGMPTFFSDVSSRPWLHLSAGLKLGSSLCQAAIEGPQWTAGKTGGGKQLGINPTQSPPIQMVSFQERQCFRKGHGSGLRQSVQEFENLCAVVKIAAGKLADHMRVAEDSSALEEIGELLVASSEVIDPYRCVDEHSHAVARLLGVLARFGSVPARRASRRALSIAINASSPWRTSAVFSVIPLRARAFLTRSSSRLMVVLMHIMMHV